MRVPEDAVTMDRSMLLAVFAAALAVAGLGAFALGRLLVAGVLMLATSLTIYVRETRT